MEPIIAIILFVGAIVIIVWTYLFGNWHKLSGRQLTYTEKEWSFAREVILEIKKQERSKLTEYPQGDGIAFNVACLLDKNKPIPIEDFGKY